MQTERKQRPKCDQIPSPLYDSTEGRTWEKQILKADTDVSFSSLLSVTVTLLFEGGLVGPSLTLVSKTHSNKHTSSIGNLSPFAQLMSINMEPNP